MTEKTEQAAMMIANAILATPATERALMLTHVAILLSRQGAPYTASVVKQLAVAYDRAGDDTQVRAIPVLQSTGFQANA